MENCVAELAAVNNLTRAQAQRVLEQVDARAERLMREAGLTEADAMRQASQDLAALEQAAAQIEKRNQLLNLEKRVARRERLMDVAQTLGGKRGVDLVTALRNQIVAIYSVVPGARASAERVWKTRVADYIGGIEADLKQAGLLDVFGARSLSDQWASELFEMSRRDAGLPSKVGKTGSPEAMKIAEILGRYQALAKERLNRHGAWIGDYAGYITRTAHDMDQVRRAGFDAWRAAIEPKLDARTFDGVDDRTGFLRGVWEALSTGVHLDDSGGVGMKDPAFTGPSNLARKASQDRVLHFADDAGWLAYQKQFGTGTLEEQFFGSIQRAARQEALLSRWGTNPLAEFQADIRYLQEEFRATHQDAVVELSNKAASLQRLFGYLDGRNNTPASAFGAKLAAGLRAASSMSHLGGVAFTHVSTLISKALELRYQGIGFLERYGDFFDSLFHGLNGADREHLADLILAGVETGHGGILAQVAAGDTVHGTMARTTNSFFRLTGLNYLLKGQKDGAGFVMARHLGRMLDRDFDSLPPETQRAFTQYDISAADWDHLRTAPDHPAIEGRSFLVPDAALRSTSDLDAGARDALALKLHSYLADVADRSTITPGIAERDLLQMGTQPGTAVGEALRFMSQFKLWGVTATRMTVGRALNGGETGLARALGVVELAAGTVGVGYLIQSAKSLYKGQVPRPANDPMTWAATMIQGGGFGIMGDFLFGEFNRAGGNIASTLAGPVLGEGLIAIDTIRSHLLAGATGHDPTGKQIHDLGPEMLRLGLNNTPLINLF